MGPHKQYVYIRKSVSCERVSLQVPNAGIALTSLSERARRQKEKGLL